MKTIVLAVAVAALCIWLAVSASLDGDSAASVAIADPGADEGSSPASSPVPTVPATAHSAAPRLQSAPRTEAKPAPVPIGSAGLRARQLRLLDDELAGQSTDAKWSSWAEQQIHEVLGASDAIKNLSVACRDTLCKLEATMASSDRIAEDVQTLLTQFPWDMGAFFEVSRERGTLTMYVSREGSELPVVEI